jgi:hypothetical protein
MTPARADLVPLCADAVSQTADSIVAVQGGDGRIPWFPGGQTDPWDHIECAMALDVAGRHEHARAAYDWLRLTQNPDGSWYHSYRDHEVADHTRESNFAAYLGVGLLHHVRSTDDEALLELMWPTLCAALRFVLALQASGGEIAWARGTDGAVADEALLTGCSSMYHGLRCAVALAQRRGQPQPDWELAAATLGHAIATHPDRFSPRDRYSMDWYYPILGGVLRGDAAHQRLVDRWDRFVVPGLGLRCVDDRPWVTGAETCELVLALCALGEFDRAGDMFASMQHLRHDDGSYWTGFVYPDDARWPEERTTWTAAAALLASGFLAGDPATSFVFGGEDLPVGPHSVSVACGDDGCAVALPSARSALSEPNATSSTNRPLWSAS